MRTPFAVVLLGGLLAGLGPGRADGQDDRTPHRTAADTGRMTWGHQEFARYTTPSLCDRAVDEVRAELIWRRAPSRMVSDGSYLDTVPAPVTAVARACGTQFTAAGAAPHELRSLFRLAVARRDTALARQTVDRLFATAIVASQRDSAAVRAVRAYRDASPALVASLDPLLHQVDQLGATAKPAQFMVRAELLDYWRQTRQEAVMRQEAQALMDRVPAMTPTERDDVSLLMTPYEMLAEHANAVGDLATQVALVARGRHDAGGWRRGEGLARMKMLELLVQLRTQFYGHTTHALPGTYWFNTGNTPRPKPGAVSLLVHVNPMCGGACASQFAAVRRLRQHFGDSLEITLLADTYGYAINTGPLPADSEAAQVAHYYLERLALPVSLLVEPRAIVKQPNGTVQYGSSPISSMFNGWELLNAVLVDRTGTIRWLGVVVSLNELPELETAIARVIGAGTSSEAPNDRTP